MPSPSHGELCSGVDALYLSARGTPPPSLLTDLELARCDAESQGLSVRFMLGGYPFGCNRRPGRSTDGH